ncbi:hypothetical protein CRT60_01130 [Azospirillum palustre]|uniref:Nucleotide modification associated domain-containing protein n=1 Tax=Azospirillum palustre TaxID=2044885 RepID=A0A2B8BN34_9PROT|nr:hypothetical protein [Azospirillum palustre]PGH59265.1 hypothetical protein CRT60_01130 [Azospirillum palustre]
MKIILSRKGFDTGYGGKPSPILQDGRFFPLPIPYDRGAPIRYTDLPCPPGLEAHYATLADYVIGHSAFRKAVVEEDQIDGRKPKTKRVRVTTDTLAHLDPDLHQGMRPRPSDWKPLFGQTGRALKILRKNEVGVGDVFVFWGLYDRLVPGRAGRPPRYEGKRMHCIFGWLQVGRVHQAPFPDLPAWGRYHPHAGADPGVWDEDNNWIFEAADRLSLEGLDADLPGAGIFPRFRPDLRLTRPGALRVDDWRLPSSFGSLMQAGRWTCVGQRNWQEDDPGWMRFSTAGQWQEGVWDPLHAPGTLEWLAGLFRESSVSLESDTMIGGPADDPTDRTPVPAAGMGC